MLRSFLIGLVAGQRGMTPLAAVATATRRGALAPDLPLQKLLLTPWLPRVRRCSRPARWRATR